MDDSVLRPRLLNFDRPALLVVFELERSRPRTYVVAQSPADLQRLVGWLETRPELHELACEAIRLEDAERA